MRAEVARTEALDVLLLDAQHRQTLACARVLQRSGWRVGVAACRPDADVAPAMYTRSKKFSVVLPEVSNGPAFAKALIATLDAHSSRVVLPAHDGTIEAIRKRRIDIERRTSLGLASEHALSVATSKSQTMALAQALGLLTPHTVELASPAELAAALHEVGLPAVIKPGHSWAERSGVGIRVTSALARTLAEAEAASEWIIGAGGTVLVQQWLSGRRDAVSFFVADGVIRARFAQTSYREFPALGGVSVLCESIPLLDDIAGPAERIVRAIGVEGPSMVEFRRDALGRPVLMEVNPRMGGSVSLAVRSGVDLPGLTFAWAAGEPVWDVTRYRTGERVRWLSGDVWNLKTTFASQAGPDVPTRGRALARFFADFAVRPSVLEPFDARDPIPALVDFSGNVLHPLRRRVRRVVMRTGRGLQKRFAGS